MKRSREGTAVLLCTTLDPCIAETHRVLEQSVTFFMANVGDMCARYNMLLQRSLPYNPKSRGLSTPTDQYSQHQRRDATPTSPLLRRPRLDPQVIDEQLQLGRAVLDTALSDDFPRTNSSGGSPKRCRMTAPVVTTPAPATGAASGPAADSPITRFPPSQLTEAEGILLSHQRLVKTEAQALLSLFERIMDWIALNIPEMKSEDNIGVTVLAAVMNNLNDMASTVRNMLPQEKSYLSDRATFDMKMMRHTDCDALATEMEAAYGDAWDTVERAWRTLIRVILLVHSILAKNMRELQEPRKSHAASLTL